MVNKTIDCRSEEGITIGLIDSLIYISRILSKRDLSGKHTQEALKDLLSDEDFNNIINNDNEKGETNRGAEEIA